MQRNKDASLGDRLICGFLRFFVLVILAVVALGLWMAAAKGAHTSRDALMLLVIGSLMGFFAQAFADFGGAYSRFYLINRVVHLYSLVWLPAVAFFLASRLYVGAFQEAGASSLAAGFFALIWWAARSKRRERAAIPATA